LQTNNDDNKPATATATLSPSASNNLFVEANIVGGISATRNPSSFTFAGGIIVLGGNNTNGCSGIGGKNNIMFGSTANNNAAFGASSFGKKTFSGGGGNNNNTATASSAGGSGTGFGFVKMNPMPWIAPKGSNTNIITIELGFYYFFIGTA